MKTNYLFLAEGYEIAEAMCPVDMMTRGGLQVKTVSITEEHLVHSSHGIGIMADLNWSEFLKETENQDIDGEGVLAFRNRTAVPTYFEFVLNQHQRKKGHGEPHRT